MQLGIDSGSLLESQAKVDQMKCPKLNRVPKTNITKDTKDEDNQLAKLQTLFLDAIGPLAHMLEVANEGNLIPEW